MNHSKIARLATPVSIFAISWITSSLSLSYPLLAQTSEDSIFNPYVARLTTREENVLGRSDSSSEDFQIFSGVLFKSASDNKLCILTAYHGVKDDALVSIYPSGNTIKPNGLQQIRLLASDPSIDLALLEFTPRTSFAEEPDNYKPIGTIFGSVPATGGFTLTGYAQNPTVQNLRGQTQERQLNIPIRVMDDKVQYTIDGSVQRMIKYVCNGSSDQCVVDRKDTDTKDGYAGASGGGVFGLDTKNNAVLLATHLGFFEPPTKPIALRGVAATRALESAKLNFSQYCRVDVTVPGRW